MQSYLVQGIIQACLHSRWSETPVRREVRAMDRKAAIAAILAEHEQEAVRIDPYALVRWYSQASAAPTQSNWCV